MFTRKALETTINNFLTDLQSEGYSPEKAILFGSYAKGNPHNESDIDLAVWDKKFIGIKSLDILPILPLFRKYPKLEVHFFNPNDPDPFEEEILRTGVKYQIAK